MVYLMELEFHFLLLGEIIENLKTKLDESYKEIQNLKTVIEKNCNSLFHFVIQHKCNIAI